MGKLPIRLTVVKYRLFVTVEEALAAGLRSDAVDQRSGIRRVLWAGAVMVDVLNVSVFVQKYAALIKEEFSPITVEIDAFCSLWG